MATAPLVCTEYKSSHIRQYQTFADQQAPASDLLTATTNIHIVYPCMPRSASMLAPHLSSIRMSPIEASVSGLAYGPGAQKAFGFGPGVCLLTHSGGLAFDMVKGHSKLNVPDVEAAQVIELKL